MIGIVELTKPKTNTVFFQNASISRMVEICKPERYDSPEGWMLPGPSTHIVTAIYYSKSPPDPDAFYAYDFHIQLEPEFLKKEQELTFPSEGVLTFLLEARASYWVCESGFQGSITILEHTNTALNALLDVHGKIDGYDREFNGEVEFNLSRLPAMAVKKENARIILSHALAA
jgi:hypothetical protein